MSPATLKTLHLIGVILFVGNVVVSALWKTMADRDGRLPVLRFATRLINLTDLVFTGTGATLLAVTGHLMAGNWGGLGRPWIHISYACFALSGLLWLAVLVPIQVRQARLLRGLPDDAAVPPAYRRLARWWAVAGTAATLLVLPPLWLMVAKG